jgi:hypothetical protein
VSEPVKPGSIASNVTEMEVQQETVPGVEVQVGNLKAIKSNKIIRLSE